MKSRIAILGAFLCLFVSGCTEPGETTAVGAATGGVLGAGLGAIVGNQTGNPGAGVAIGAVAGASAGAAIGNALQAQQEAIRTQDEALERQERTLRAQASEIQELRRAQSSSSDSGQFGDRYATREEISASRARVSRDMSERNLSVEKPLDSKGSYDWKRDDVADEERTAPVDKDEFSPKQKDPEPGTSAASLAEEKPLSPDCRSGFSEAMKGKQAADVSERLFHYRRALRLCPDEPAFHNGLGEVYLSLSRKADAEFEFKEALRLDPNFGAAEDNLKAISE